MIENMDLGYNFFKIDYKKVAPEKGKILIAEPFLNDTYFKRSIVFLTEHSEEGSVGFVLNKPVNIKLNEMISDMPAIETEVSIGGPVGTNSIHYIHTMGDIIPESVNVIGNIYWGGDFTTVKGMLQTGKIDKRQIKFFLGYSGWHPDQLDRELKENSWIVTEMKPSIIMEPETRNLWKNALRQLGRKYEMWSNFPEDPVLN